ncbi:hypothetical protein N7541_011461 [Penicillium brevicompactum]|uniref:Uncharacterized protein n=1 Tax=Penicillium brevicompactum TaxID=5074 RepID=A0A9W9UIK6_PENBR|nr:hypothetical protein N7541_011461 [Penicillium brevicompactum]
MEEPTDKIHDLHLNTAYISHQELWKTFWVDYHNEYPVENMTPGEQYTVTCRDFKRGLRAQILFLRAAELDRSQDVLYLTNMQSFLGVIITVAKRMHREDSDHEAVINRGVDHWDKDFERLCDEKILKPLKMAFMILLNDSNRALPCAEVDFQVAGILQRVLKVADILLSNDELPADFGHIHSGFPPDHERLSEVLPSDYDPVEETGSDGVHSRDEPETCALSLHLEDR